MPATLLRTVLLAALVSTALAPAHAQVVSIRPGAPGQPSRVLSGDPETANTPLAEADVRFMQGMIHHHAQALEMTALARTRTTTPALLTLAERIDVSQHDEIGWMQRWLREHGQDVPDVDAALAGKSMDHAAHHAMMQDAPGMAHTMMPGMLTPDEMALLENATGKDFDRLFLQYMIRHHEGGLLMVADLLAAHGGAQAPDVYHIITDIDADQRADIQRMLGMLDTPPLPSILRRN